MIRVRRAVPADAVAMVAIDAACFPDDSLWSYDDVIELIVDRWRDVLVADEDGDVLGYVVVRFARTWGEIDLDYDEATWLGPVAVHPEHRERSVGRRLVEQAIGPHEIVWLKVDVDNVAARRLYRSLKFGEDGPPEVLADQIADDEVCMKLELWGDL